MLPVAILAGGLATRLRPLTENIPKSLVPVAGVPFAAHQLRLLRARGVERVVFCVGYRGEMIQEYVGDGERFGLAVEYAWDGPTLRGTAGAIRGALHQLGDAFFTLYGDSYLPCDYAAVEEAFLASGASALMTVFRNEGQWDRSNVEFENGQIFAYDKNHPNPRMQYIDYGLGMFHAAAFDGLHSDLAGLYRDLLAKGRLAGLEIPERFYEIGSLAGIREIERYLL